MGCRVWASNMHGRETIERGSNFAKTAAVFHPLQMTEKRPLTGVHADGGYFAHHGLGG